MAEETAEDAEATADEAAEETTELAEAAADDGPGISRETPTLAQSPAAN